MTYASSRRWLRFSLRTLFVVVTVFGIWLGYQVNWIHQRREFMWEAETQLGQSGFNSIRANQTGNKPRSPQTLAVFGEEGYAQLDFYLVLGPAEISYTKEQLEAILQASPQVRRMERAKQLFPEAKVRWGYLTHAGRDPLRIEEF